MYFDEEAKKWDTPLRVNRAKSLANSIRECLPKKKEITGMELGCGTGLISCELSNLFNEIYCVDTSVKMLSVLTDKLTGNKISNIYTEEAKQIYSGDYLHKFDVIFSSMVFHHILDIEKELLKLQTLLKENGCLIIIDLDTVDRSFHEEEKDFNGHDGFERISLQNIMEKNGYKNVSFKTVYEGEKKTQKQVTPYTLFLGKAYV